MWRVLILLLVTGLSLNAQSSSNAPAATATGTNLQIFQVKGVVVGVEPDGKSVRIKHEAIPGYMAAMTMPFEVKSTIELAGLNAGDAVVFRLTVTDNDAWIDQIQKQAAPSVALSANSMIRIGRDAEPLKEGDVVPDYAFTNQLGKRIHLWQFKGQALAVTFLFTRCPLPTYCPLMSKNFAEVQKKLLAMKGGPTNWHLLTISFDPEFDKPEVLKTYANLYSADPHHWSLATGSLEDITTFGDQLELQFWREPDGNISHNLRTVVIDRAGVLQKIIYGNKWTSDELVEDLVKAAATK